MRNRYYIILFTLIAFLCAGTDGTLRGKITDADGVPLIGTQIYMPDLEKGTTADRDGNYIILNLPVGDYEVRFLMIGYQTKISALIMAIFSVSLAIIFHTDFSNQMQVMSFLKNFAIAGGFIIIFVNGPSRWSIDYMLKSKTK